VVNRNGVKQILRLDLEPQEQEAFRKSAEAVKGVIKAAGL